MASTVIGIVYGSQSKIIRRVIIPDDDNELKDYVGPGETLVTIPQATVAKSALSGPALINSLFLSATGVSAANPRCAVVDKTGTVINVIMADPLIDSVPNCTLTLSQTADIGWTTSSGILVKPSTGVVAIGPTALST